MWLYISIKVNSGMISRLCFTAQCVKVRPCNKIWTWLNFIHVMLKVNSF